MASRTRPTPDDRAARRAFYQRVQRRLKALEMNREALSRELGVSSGNVSDWFNKLQLPLGSVMLRLPTVLRCSGHWLLTGEGPEHAPRSPSADFRAGARAALADVEDALETVASRAGYRTSRPSR